MREKLNATFFCAVFVIVASACSSTQTVPAHEWLPEPSYEGFDSDMPGIKRPASTPREFYPSKAKQLGHSGRVWVGFAINMQGRAENISVVQTDFDDLASGAVNLLRSYEFSLAKVSDKSSLGTRRYCLGFMFVIRGMP